MGTQRIRKSFQFTRSVVSDSLRPHELQNARLLGPSPTPGAYSNSCPLSQWYHPTILSSVVCLFSHLQSLPESLSFPRSQFFVSGGQSIRVSALASVLLMNIQDWFPLGWTPCSPRTLKSLLQHHHSKTSILRHSAFFMVQLSYPYMTTGETIALIRQTFVREVRSLLFNMMPGFIIAFLPRSKHLLTSRLQSPSTVIWQPKKTSLSLFPLFPNLLPWSDGTGCHDLSFLNTEF